MRGTIYIIELGKEELGLCAQLLHLYLANYPNDPNAKSALEHLRQQTNFVSLEPKDHKVYPDALSAPDRAKKFEEVYFIRNVVR